MKKQNIYGPFMKQSEFSLKYATRYCNHNGRAKTKAHNRKLAKKRLKQKIMDECKEDF